MGASNIPLDKAELLSVLLESLLYGFSLFMFGGTIWALSSQRSTLNVNYKMLAAACALLLCSTVHLVIDIVRVMEGLILLRDNPGGPLGYFSNVSHWTFVFKNYVYAAQTLVGDGVVLYRCYAVWQSKLVMIIPVLLWCAVAVTGFGCPTAEAKVTEGEVFDGSLGRWIIAFWTTTLMTNMVSTLLLAWRIWNVDRRASRLCDHRKTELRPIMHVIVDAGLIYSVTLFAALMCFVNKSNGQYVILDMIMPIISITFYMVIIRVGLSNRTHHPTNALSIGQTSSGHSFSADRRSKLHIEISEVSRSHRSSIRPVSAREFSPNGRRSEIKFNDITEEDV